MIDNYRAVVEFVRAYDRMRECQLRLLLMAPTSPDRAAARGAMETAEDKADALRRRFDLSDEEPDPAQLSL